MPSSSPYYDSTCDTYSLSQAIEIPIPGDPLVFILNPQDISFEDEQANATLSIKYDRFTRDLSAVFKTFNITLYSLPASEVVAIESFANSDFLTNVLTNGRGSLTVFFAGQQLDNCYIQGPITKGQSIYKNWLEPPEEVFDSIAFKVVSPNVNWY